MAHVSFTYLTDAALIERLEDYMTYDIATLSAWDSVVLKSLMIEVRNREILVENPDLEAYISVLRAKGVI